MKTIKSSTRETDLEHSITLALRRLKATESRFAMSDLCRLCEKADRFNATKATAFDLSSSTSFAKVLRDAKDAIASFKKGYQRQERDESKGLLGKEDDISEIFFRITHLSKETLLHANSIAESLKEDTDVFKSNTLTVK